MTNTQRGGLTAGGRSASGALTAAVTAVAPVIWGSTYLVTTEFLPPGRPWLATTVRVLPAGLALLAVNRVRLTGVWLWRIVVLSLLNVGAFNVLLFVAAYRLPGGIAAMVMSVQPMFVLVLAAALIGDRIRPVHVLACGLGVGGVGLLVVKGTVALDTVGVVAALTAAVVMAAGITLTKRWGRPAGMGLLPFTGWQFAVAGLMTLPFALALEGLPNAVTGRNLAGFGYLLIGTVISYALWFRGLEKLPALAVSFLALGSPVVATVLGYVFLRQALSPAQLLGIVVIIIAVLLAQPRPGKPAAADR